MFKYRHLYEKRRPQSVSKKKIVNFAKDVKTVGNLFTFLTFSVSGGGEKYKLDQGAVSDIRDVLAEQQRGIQALMQCVKDDFRDLDVIVKKIKDD